MYYIKLLLLDIVIIISVVFAHGDGDHKHDRGKPAGCTIYGTVLDSITNKPMEYVSISVIESEGSIITGDITQIELVGHSASGLIHAVDILKKIKGIKFIHFNENDVIRHQLVKNIIKAYSKEEK